MNSENNMPIWPGWETVRLIGRGSYGSVYEIERDVLGEKEKAAMKVIRIPQSDSDISDMYSEGYDDESITSTFNDHLKNIISEYTLMRKLNGSANVVNCDDVRYEQHEDGVGWDIFIKMELLKPLTAELPADASDETVIKVGCDICRALELCRHYDIIHRDIKPQNIFVSPHGDYKLGDFGVAKTVEKTSGGTKIGTYKYMAPEVYKSEPYGACADLYSLGIVLYWMLNERRLPFLPLPPEKLSASLEEQARLRRFNGEALPAPAHGSERLKQIVLKACAYDPQERYQTAEEMRADLQILPANKKPDDDSSIEQSADSESVEEEDTLGAWKKIDSSEQADASEDSEEEEDTLGAWKKKDSSEQADASDESEEEEETLGAWKKKDSSEKTDASDESEEEEETLGAWKKQKKSDADESDENKSEESRTSDSRIKREKNSKKSVILLISAAALAIIALTVFLLFEIPKNRLERALTEERWEDAIILVDKTGYSGKKKSEIIIECRYQIAMDALEAHDWNKAADAFKTMHYKDSNYQYEVALRSIYSDADFIVSMEQAIGEFLSSDRRTFSGQFNAYNALMTKLGKYADMDFYDPQLGALAEVYVRDLKSMLEWSRLVNEYSCNICDYQINMWPLIISNNKTLKILNEEFGLMKDSKAFKEEFIKSIDELEYQYTVIQTFQESFIKSRSNKTASGWYSSKQQFIRYTNDTGYELPGVTFFFTSYDADGIQTEYDEVTMELPMKKQVNIVFDCNSGVSKSWNWDWYINF